jgi:hypothetical protein
VIGGRDGKIEDSGRNASGKNTYFIKPINSVAEFMPFSLSSKRCRLRIRSIRPRLARHAVPGDDAGRAPATLSFAHGSAEERRQQTALPLHA